MSQLEKVQSETKAKEVPAENYFAKFAFAPLVSQAIYVVAKLKIADLLADGPVHVSKLAQATESHERSLYRVLRSLASVGIFEEVDPKVFALNPDAETLRSDAKGSIRDGAIFMGADWHWQVWGNLLYSVQTGKPAWGKVHGKEVFDYFADNKTESEVFNRAMTSMSESSAPGIVAAYDFSSFETVVDVAGGHGRLLIEILKANPDTKGILFDVPQVIEGATELIEGEHLGDRIQTIAGSFFESVPAGADAYILKHIIHDWDDEQSIEILKNINRNMRPDACVLLAETVVPEDNNPHMSKMLDLEMMVSPGGIERTRSEFAELFAAAGLRLTRIVEAQAGYYVIEAVRA